jgi:signal transduction histidine kinase
VGRWLQTTTFAPERLPPRWRHPLIGYLAASLLSLLAALVTLLLLRALPAYAFALPDLFSLAALVVIALVWGAGPSLVAIGLSVVLLQTVVLPLGAPSGPGGLVDAVDLLLFFAISLTLTLVASAGVRARRDARAAAAIAEARWGALHLLLEELPSGVCLVRGVDARLVLANRTAAAMWGAEWPQRQPMQTFLQAHGIRVLAPNGQSLPGARHAATRALRGERVRQQAETIRHGDGTALPVVVNAVPLDPRTLSSVDELALSDALALSGEQQFAGASGAASVQQLAEQLEKDRAGDRGEPREQLQPMALVVFQDVSALREAERLKDEFVAMAAHELRNPIGVLVFYTEWLFKQAARHDSAARDASERGKEESKASARRAEAIDAIHKTAERLSALTNDLLDVTRLQAGRLELQREPHDLVALAQRVTERMQVTSTQHRLAIETAAEHLIVSIDARRIEQVLTNLLSNAIKYSPNGGPVTVTLGTDAASGSVLVSVRDAGIGIPADQRSQLFGRFARALNARQLQIEGTGLGLYLCRELVELHGGHMWFDSTEGVGSTFYFTVPLVARPKTAQPTAG